MDDAVIGIHTLEKIGVRLYDVQTLGVIDFQQENNRVPIGGGREVCVRYSRVVLPRQQRRYVESLENRSYRQFEL